MKRSLWIRLVVFTIALFLGVLVLLPSIKAWTGGDLTPNEKERAIHLGLDLVGGMHLVIEVDTTGSGMSSAEAATATDNAIEILRGRIDKWGTSEPNIQRVGNIRIQVQLPEIKDRESALRLIGKTGKLQFRMLASPEKTKNIFSAIDNKLLALDSMSGFVSTRRSFSSYLIPVGADAALLENNYDTLRSLLADAQDVIPDDVEVLFGRVEDTIRRIYVISKNVEITGDDIDGDHVLAKPYQGQDPNNMGTWMVEMGLKRKGQYRFAEVTELNKGRRLAIVLDEIVQSAPTIKERIPPGTRPVITTGDRKGDKTQDLSNIIAHGALPLPLKIIEERTVSPTLGRDSIKAGLIAIFVGLLAVVVFMLIYYTGAGLIAITALVFNLFWLMATLSGLGFTLTLPGLAGIALTIGMAVDANVLIYERIRDELRAGKFPRSAVETGFSKAARIIIDANITTIIAAVVLWRFNKGPVQGFAVTLIFGLVVNMITVIYLSRGLFDLYLFRKPDRKLYI